MRNIFTKVNLFKVLTGIVLGISFLLIPAYSAPSLAVCPPNVVPNPLDPDCNAPAGGITVGFIVNRFIVFLPAIVVLAGIIGYSWGAFKVMLGGEDGKEEGIKIWVRVTIGLVLFFSIWLILFLVSIITGFDLLAAIGQ